MKKLELLAPAGSYESIIAAVNAGADAVYTGGKKFGARAYADNAGEDMLLKGLDYAHHFGVKVYMTVNTLLKDKEMEELEDYIKPYYEAGMDALIVQDIGVFSLLRERFPDLDIHISTQMSITGYRGAGLLYDMGASRVVPARELSLEEIRKIDKNCDIEIECFVHGALCYAYSGQCLMSSLIGGRSGNRGRCAQTCRLNYELYQEGKQGKKKLNKEKERNLLSCKDLCSLDILPDIAEAGVDSLKIEGRMKSPRYTAGVVGIWRKYVDLYASEGREGYRVEAGDRKLLLELFDRGGQTEGYYHMHNGKEMMAFAPKPEFRQANEEYFKYLEDTYINTFRKLPLYGKISIKAGERIRLHLAVKGIQDKEREEKTRKMQNTKLPIFEDKQEAKILAEVVVYGDIPQAAKTRAAESDEIKKQILKTGNTLYEFEKLDINLEEGLFIPNKALNELRRNAVAELEKEILRKYRRKYRENTGDKGGKSKKFSEAPSPKDREKKDKPLLHVVCEEKHQLEAVIDFCKNKEKKIKDTESSPSYIDEISFEADTTNPQLWKEYVDKLHKLGIAANLYLPHIFRSEAEEYFAKYETELKNAGFDGFLIRSLEEIVYLDGVFCKEAQKPLYIFDYTLYGFNIGAEKSLYELGAGRQTLPVELNLKELRRLGCKDKELIVYGKIPMMVSAQCLRKNTIGCDKNYSVLFLKDRYKKEMPVKNRCHFCYNSIYNADPISVLDIGDDILALKPSVLRLWLSTEEKPEIEELLRAYIRRFKLFKEAGEISKSFTRGHLKRGVE